MLIKKAFLVVLFSLFVSGGSYVYAQGNLKGKLNEFVDNNKKNVPPPALVEQPKKTVETPKQPVSEVLPTPIKILPTDNQPEDNSAFAEQPIIEEIIEEAEIDSLAFKKRLLGVRNLPFDKSLKEADWQKKFLVTDAKAYKKPHVLDSLTKVFGWHPYWMGTAYQSYNFSLLSAVAYFSYELNPATGNYTTVHDWNTTALIDSAHAHQCKVLLSVTNPGYKNNLQFLSNVNAQRTFINNVILLLEQRKGDGVHIDFELIPASKREAFTNFIIDLSSSLRAKKKNAWLTISVPPIDFDAYDVKQLNNHVNLYVVLGYEFYGSNSKVAGPLSPITSGQSWWLYNLERVVDEYVIAGVPPSKLLLALSYYGAEWQTNDLKFPSAVKKFVQYPTYRDIRKTHGDVPCCIDQPSMSKVYVYRDKGNNYRQIWYEDSTSLALKYDWIHQKKIGGVGIWALGYDNGYDELWKLIAAKFTQKPKVASASKGQPKLSRGLITRLLSLAMRVLTNPRSVLTNPSYLVSIFGLVFGVSVTGLLVLYRFGYQIKRLTNLALKGGIALTILVMIALVFFAFRFTELNEITFLILGFLIGAIIFFLFSRQFLSEKDLP